MSTIRDVARRAGVAPITVSRVINNSGYVSHETRQRVETAIAEMNYIPNRLGPSLRSKRTYTIALVVTDITNPFWTTAARGAEDAAHAAGYHLVLCNSDESPEKQQDYLELLLSRQVDGFLLVPAESVAAPIEMVQQQDVALVVLDRRVPTTSVDVVRTDSTGGAFALTQHLLALGHRDIVMITGPAAVSTARDRVEGYRQAMQEAGIPAEQRRIYRGQYTQDTGYALTMEAMQTSSPPTALFAANNFIAIGAMRAFTELGLDAPDDVSIVSFDDLPEAITIKPFFTVVSQPAYDMGFQAANILLRRMSDDDAPFEELVLPFDLIVRQSSGPVQA